MEYVYAALILNESDEEINEENLTNVLDAAGVDVEESRAKALVAALEDVEIEEAIEQGTAVPAGGAGGGAPAGGADADTEETEEAEEAEDEAEEAEDAGDDEDEDADGEGLGALFG
ncbi:50S ribosomal protein P1 [Halobacteriales archaeon QS_3_64_16]|nr:MAG: 50S ribosomal protein P1 [Halobacteriales archaeon QS_3_64_16]